MLKVYAYKSCSTCRHALNWLREQEIPFTELAIRETPPSVAELEPMLAAQGGNLRALLNTSGQDYRALNMKEKLPDMTPAEVLSLLAEHGNLVKRPFAVDETAGVYLTGFKPEQWAAALAK